MFPVPHDRRTTVGGKVHSDLCENGLSGLRSEFGERRSYRTAFKPIFRSQNFSILKTWLFFAIKLTFGSWTARGPRCSYISNSLTAPRECECACCGRGLEFLTAENRL